jgi:predicted DNA-binding ribbon-helix-helix protein
MATGHRGRIIFFIRRSGRVRGRVMKSTVIKHSVLTKGRKTSISLENEFWDALREIALRSNVTLSKLVEQVDQGRNNINLSSAIRVFVFNHFRALSEKASGSDWIRRFVDSRALRVRAQECRALADGFKDTDTRAIMLKVAADYELFAERLEYAGSAGHLHTEGV